PRPTRDCRALLRPLQPLLTPASEFDRVIRIAARTRPHATMKPMDSSPRAALELAYRHALDYLDSLPTRPVAATASLAHLRARLRKPLNDSPIDAATVVRDLVCDTHEGLVASAGGRFFAWAVSGTLPSALAADWLTSAWDQNAGIYVAGPAASVVE